ISLESQIKEEVKLAMQDPSKKQKLIDEYCEFLFYGRRDKINFNKFPDATRQESFYSFDEFGKLKDAFTNANRTGLSFFDTLLETTSFTKSADGSVELVPSASSKFFANFLFHEKWQNDWRKESAENFSQKFPDTLTADIFKQASGVGNESNLSIYDLQFIVSKLLLGKSLNLIEDYKNSPKPDAINIYFASGHYSGCYYPNQHLADQRVGDLRASGVVASGGGGYFGSSTSLASGLVQPEQLDLKYNYACMSLLNDQNVEQLINLSGPSGGQIDVKNGVKFYRNKNQDSCLELNGNVFLLNRPGSIPTKANGTNLTREELQNAKSDLIRNVEYIINIAEVMLPTTSPVSSSGAPASRPRSSGVKGGIDC
ncbi:MAG: hypothetical protein ACKN9I_02235, partial [Alphaproteobacteria bacterium]